MGRATFTVEYHLEGDSVGNAHDIAVAYQNFLGTYVASREPFLHLDAHPVRLESAVINTHDSQGKPESLVVNATPVAKLQPVPGSTPEGFVAPVDILKEPIPIDDEAPAAPTEPHSGTVGEAASDNLGKSTKL